MSIRQFRPVTAGTRFRAASSTIRRRCVMKSASVCTISAPVRSAASAAKAFSRSAGVPASSTGTRSPSVRAQMSFSRRRGAVYTEAGFTRMATRLTPGTASLFSSSRLA